jgi:tRNA(Ile)-lysidine synthase
VLIASEVAALPRASARLLVRRWLAGQGGTVRLSRRVLDAVVDLCQSSNGSRQLSLSDGLRVERKYDKLTLAPADAGDAPALPDSVILPVPGRAQFAQYEIEAVTAPSWEVGSGDPMRVVVDADSLVTPLVVRAWRPGDRFAPLGLSGSKSIQDLFVDEKIPRDERGRIPIVTSGHDIVWVCGMRVSEDFKVTSRSERLVGFQATRRIVDHPV